ncbi:hypothetical protein CSOJ01_09069 [Colletotrichum sojae]|uniref:Uncharacterized protein n=1 Tax=Colletotrichum sojae TaxID=2175907 RepID=A0A8H6MS11_9PEZI|nr:hypothetical protein CSOJ01_09069 [Colletotrichum sojae]
MPGHKSSSSSSKHSSSRGHGSRSSGGSSKKPAPPQSYVWYCSNCSLGPFNCTLDAYCPNCSHLRCTDCNVQARS